MYYYIGAPYRVGEVPPWGGAVSTKDGYSCASGASGTTSTAYAICVNNGTASSGSSNSSEQWIAYTTPYYIYLAKLPIVANTVAGRTFYIYNPEKVIARSVMSKATFLADPITAIKNAPIMPVGSTYLASRHIFNLAQLQSENTTLQNTTIDNLDTVIENRYICTQNQV